MTNADIYEMVTSRIITALENGVAAWNKPWVGGGLPFNASSKRPYRGINVFILALAGYSNPGWMTYKNAKSHGGTVKKGQKATTIIFWKVVPKKERSETTGKMETNKIFLLRYYNVFNVEQIEGLPERFYDLGKAEDNAQERIDECERVVREMENAPIIEHNEARAYYAPMFDRINMPKFELFKKAEQYYSTIFHELGHSTGHQSRLNRDSVTDLCPFGSTNYSKEELVAEMTAAMVCGVVGIENETVDNSAAYIKSWLGKLQDDPKLVVSAAQQAQKAADMILNVKWGEEKKKEKD